jgi:hypothetical protein
VYFLWSPLISGISDQVDFLLEFGVLNCVQRMLTEVLSLL